MMILHKAILAVGFLKLVWVSSMPVRNDEKMQDYFRKRQALIGKFKSTAIGGNLKLTDAEKKVNNKLMKWKFEEFEDGVKNPKKFLAGQNFFSVKADIDRSPIFNLIKALPKGASLHAHSSAMVSEDYVIYNITYRDNLYGFEDTNGVITLKFSDGPANSSWKSVSQLRKEDNNFNERLWKQLTLARDKPEVFYADKDINEIWKMFNANFAFVKPILRYRPVYEDYFYQALKELYEDNVRYLEFRSPLSNLYDLDGREYNSQEVLTLHQKISEKFIEDYPDFWGVKLIYAIQRYQSQEDIQKAVEFVNEINKKSPKFVVGFDLVGQEDLGWPLKDFLPALFQLNKGISIFLHGGETLWNGLQADENLIDAVLLNATRIGHAYALTKHPEVLKMVKDNKIGLEICPISNQVLGLVKDLRNHPANYLIANNYPVVITTDDPTFWRSKALSYDWYMAFMGMSSKYADLRLLKQLAVNSIIYSGMDTNMKKYALEKWAKDWETFLEDEPYNNNNNRRSRC